jgi:hypothetical protein
MRLNFCERIPNPRSCVVWVSAVSRPDTILSWENRLFVQILEFLIIYMPKWPTSIRLPEPLKIVKEAYTSSRIGCLATKLIRILSQKFGFTIRKYWKILIFFYKSLSLSPNVSFFIYYIHPTFPRIYIIIHINTTSSIPSPPIPPYHLWQQFPILIQLRTISLVTYLFIFLFKDLCCTISPYSCAR